MGPESGTHSSLILLGFFQIDLIKKVTVRQEEKKVNRQDFQLKDKTDSIMISMWRDHTKQCKGLSVGDIIKITNMKISKYYENTSLNSTGFTKIHKVICCKI